MQPVFIRHNLSASHEVLERLWRERTLAIHFDDVRSLAPADYGTAGRLTLERLLRYSREGAIVGATFHKIQPARLLVGRIAPGSAVSLLSGVQPDETPECFYKVVQLADAREVSYVDHPLLAAIQPRQGTLTGWPSAERHLRAALEGTPLPWDVASLHPSQLEVLCYEYLRSKGIIAALLLPIGRTLIDVDIMGLDYNGHNVIAQVTHSPDQAVIKRKLRTLAAYGRSTNTLVFFGPNTQRAEVGGVKYVAIEDVFDSLAATDCADLLHKVIERMLNRSIAA